MKTKWGDLHKAHTLATVPVLLAAAAFSSQTMAAGAPVSALEDRVNQMEQELQSLRDELARNKAADEECCGDVQQLEQRVATLEQTPEQTHHDNMLFFRGGYTEMLDDRGFSSFGSTHDTLGIGAGQNAGDQGWFIGAGFDFVLTHDVWGLLPQTWVLAELGLGYNRYESEKTTLVVPTFECAARAAVGREGGAITGADIANCIVTGQDTMTTLNISAAPKLRFLEGSRIRPWVIPIGLDINVISPPSDSATVTDIGMLFGAGVDYEIIDGIFIGIDGRYHWSADETNTANDFVARSNNPLVRGALPAIVGSTDQDRDYWQVGGYVGIGF